MLLSSYCLPLPLCGPGYGGALPRWWNFYTSFTCSDVGMLTHMCTLTQLHESSERTSMYLTVLCWCRSSYTSPSRIETETVDYSTQYPWSFGILSVVMATGKCVTMPLSHTAERHFRSHIHWQLHSIHWHKYDSSMFGRCFEFLLTDKPILGVWLYLFPFIPLCCFLSVHHRPASTEGLPRGLRDNRESEVPLILLPSTA